MRELFQHDDPEEAEWLQERLTRVVTLIIVIGVIAYYCSLR